MKMNIKNRLHYIEISLIHCYKNDFQWHLIYDLICSSDLTLECDMIGINIFLFDWKW